VGEKGWSLLFGVVLLATFLLWIVAALVPGWWLPPNVASYGGAVDGLFYLILGFTGFFLVLTHAIQVYVMYRFAHRAERRSVYTHGNHRLELLWTAVPAAILLFIAFTQIQAWANIKYQSRMPPPDLVVGVTARQWEWRMRYPVEPEAFSYTEDSDSGIVAQAERNARHWAEHPAADDLHLANEIHTWVNANVKIYLRTVDILHSFYLPNLRLKQDALPGRTIPMWFRAIQHNVEYDPDTDSWPWPRGLDARHERGWEIACAELCGARHYAMRGRLYVHRDKADYMRWFNSALSRQNARQPASPSTAP